MVASNFNNYRNSLCHFVAAIFPSASFEEKKKHNSPLISYYVNGQQRLKKHFIYSWKNATFGQTYGEIFMRFSPYDPHIINDYFQTTNSQMIFITFHPLLETDCYSESETYTP